MLKEERELLFTQLPPEKRYWGDKEYITAETRYQYKDYSGINFKLYPLTTFILKQIPKNICFKNLEYAWICGPELDNYENIISKYPFDESMTTFEVALLLILNSLSFWAVMFAPMGERLDKTVFVNSKDVIKLLRTCVYSIPDSDGFLAITNS